MLRLAPFYAKRKLALALRMRTRQDFFREELEPDRGGGGGLRI